MVGAAADGDLATSPFRAISAPTRVSLHSSSSVCSRRLSSRCSHQRGPVSQARRRPAWISLQGRLFGAEEATSARSAAPGLDGPEAVGWELFTPLQRVLLVATTAAARSHEAERIAHLQRLICIRDQLLQDMQQKIDNLCEEMSLLHAQSMKYNRIVGSEAFDFCVQVKSSEANSESDSITSGVTAVKEGPRDLKVGTLEKDITFSAEQEERRMSDLSDFGWSVASSTDNQLCSLALEQECYNLRKECEEKNAIIKEMAAAANNSTVAEPKRIVELEELLRRKNMVISKLKKDVASLKGMVVELTRSKRASHIASKVTNTDIPVMVNNILYDMSSSSPSSSDSDSPEPWRLVCQDNTVDGASIKPNLAANVGQLLVMDTPVALSSKLSDVKPKQCSVGSKIVRLDEATTKPSGSISSSVDFKRTRRSTVQKRWQ